MEGVDDQAAGSGFRLHHTQRAGFEPVAAGELIGQESLGRIRLEFPLDLVEHFWIELLNVRGLAVHGEAPPPGHMAMATIYGLSYTAVLLALAAVTFRRRDFL